MCNTYQPKYDTQKLNEIEQCMYNAYQRNCEKYLIDELCSLNNKKYIIDKLKLNYLSSILFLSFELNKVELKKSNIHGYGVFAKQKILKNELITFYPGDMVEYHPNADRHIPNHITMNYRSERYENQFDNNIHSDISKKHRNNEYAYDINEYYTIIGCSYFKDNSNYLGHFINDGAKTNSTEKSNEIYIKISNIKKNCNFYSLKDLHIAIIAIKDIEIGDELFIRYGIGYWNSYNKNTIV
jgi:SET domain-containing protein